LWGDVDLALGRRDSARERYGQALQVAQGVRSRLWAERAATPLVLVGGDPATVPAQSQLAATARQ